MNIMNKAIVTTLVVLAAHTALAQPKPLVSGAILSSSNEVVTDPLANIKKETLTPKHLYIRDVRQSSTTFVPYNQVYHVCVLVNKL